MGVSRKKVYIEKQENVHSTIRKIGREGEVGDPDKQVKFLSTIKELTLFKDDNYLIKFSNSMFITSDTKDIDYLRKHPAFKRTFFEGKYPDTVLKKMKDDKKYIELVEDAFTPAEA